MSDQFKRYLYDLVNVIHEKYNSSLQSNKDENEEEKAFRNGMNLAFYDVLDLIESQLNAFDYDVNEVGKITPELGKTAKLKRNP